MKLMLIFLIFISCSKWNKKELQTIETITDLCSIELNVTLDKDGIKEKISCLDLKLILKKDKTILNYELTLNSEKKERVSFNLVEQAIKKIHNKKKKEDNFFNPYLKN